MKLKMLLVATLCLLCCGAAFGQSYSFDFGPNSCGYETFTVGGSFAVGTDHAIACGSPADGVMLGVSVYLPTGGGSALTGKVAVFADNTYDASTGSYTGCQLLLVTRTKASTKKIGWAYYASCGDELMFLINYGYLSPHSGSQPAGNALIGPYAGIMNKKK